jgi:hypothetical protein
VNITLSLLNRASVTKMGVFLIGISGLLVAIGCKREDVREYRVPKEQPATASQALLPGHPPMDGGMPTAMPPMPKLHWTLPAGWLEKKPSAMRVANFSVAGKDGQAAEVGVIPLPTTGSELELVNMWRKQMQLPNIVAAEADKQAESIAIGAEQGKLFDIASAEPIDGKSKARILVATITRGQMSWFFKMTGEDAFVTEEKAAFAEFLKSITFEESSAPVMAAATVPSVQSESIAPSSGSPEWQTPADWKQQPPGQMVLASFAVGDEASGKAVEAIAETELDKQVITLDGGAKLVDFTGTDMASVSSKRLVGAIVPQAGKTWFYKMAGGEKVVGQQKEAFIKFVQTVKYSNAH